MGRKLPRPYYHSPNVLFLAKDLLGKKLMTHIDGSVCGGLIVETEAYRAPDDRACHAYQNRRTKRTEVMFSEGGCAYVYLCYGIHHLMNVVTGPEDLAHAILIRAIEPTDGKEVMAQRRNLDTTNKRLTNGPGSLSIAMGITTALSGTSLFGNDTPVWIEEGPLSAPFEICTSPRIGINSSGEAAKYPWRYFIKNNIYVSETNSCA